MVVRRGFLSFKDTKSKVSAFGYYLFGHHSSNSIIVSRGIGEESYKDLIDGRRRRVSIFCRQLNQRLLPLDIITVIVSLHIEE